MHTDYVHTLTCSQLSKTYDCYNVIPKINEKATANPITYGCFSL